MAKCNLCDAAIVWARTEDGKSMPLALPPNPNGNVWLEDRVNDKGKTVKTALVASKDHPKPPNTRSYTSHFQTCAVYAAKKKLERALKG